MSGFAGRARLLIIMAVGVIAMSSASIFIRFALADNAQPLTIAAYRLAIATAVLSIPALKQRAFSEYAKLGSRRIILLLASGGLLALHFAAWVTSLAHTSVLSSVVLVTTTPLWIGLASPLLLKERNTRSAWLGLLIAMAGCIVIGLSDVSGQTELTAWGDLLALSAAIFAAGYLMIGRSLRAHLSFVAYVWFVYGTAAVILIGWALVTQTPMFGLQPVTLLWLLALGLIPQLIGHSAANYVVRHLSATLVSISVLGEPIGSTVLAVLLLGETPTAWQLVGAVVILAGIAFASLSETRDRAKTSEAPATSAG